MLDYNDITRKKFIILDGQPFEVLDSQVIKKQRQKPTNQTKLRNLMTGNTKEYTFHQSDTVEEADITSREIEYIYNRRGEVWFCDPEDKSERFAMEEDEVEHILPYLTESDIVEAKIFQDDIIDVEIPIKKEFEVIEAPPNVKGDTASGATKRVKISTGLRVQTPLFIERGDIIEVNTETGEYVQRIEKR